MENPNTVVPAEVPNGASAPPEGRFRDLVEDLDAVVWEMDPASLSFTYVSPQAERLLGHPAGLWCSDPTFWTDRLLHPEDRDRVASFRAAAAEGGEREMEYRALAADGREVWLRDVVSVVRGPSGEPRLLRGLTVDAGAQKQAERRLEDRIRHAALSGEVGDAIADGGPLGHVLQRCAAALVTHLDAAFARIWTLDRTERVLELQASAGLYTHLDGAHGRVPVGSFKIGLIAEEATPHLTNDVRNDPRVSDKEWARREGMVSFAGYPLLVDGKLMGVMAMFARHPLRDETLEALRSVADRVGMIVERAETESALRERELQLAEAQRIAQLGSWEWDLVSGRIHWSDELFRIFGLLPQSEECTLDSYLARVHPDDRERSRETVESAASTGEPFQIEERVLRPDGTERVVLSRGRALTDRSRRVVKLLGTSQDVTEQRRAAARVVELAREQEARLRAEEEEERAAFLAEAGRVLSSSLDFSTTLRTFAHLAVPRIADWCAIDIVNGQGGAERVVTAHPDPAKEELALELERRYPANRDAHTGVPQVLRTGEPELIPEIPADLLEASAVDEEHLRLLRELQLHSFMVVPLTARGRTLGAISFVAAESGRRYDEEDLRFALELASRAAMAVDNARLYRDLEVERTRLREIFQRAPAFIATLRGPDHVFETANPHYIRLVGGREVVGKPVAEALPEVVEQGFLTLLDEVRRSGEPYLGTEVPVLLRHRADAPMEERFVDFVYQPLRASDATVTGIFVHGVDVTDQVRARRQVEQKAEELALLARQLEATNRELDQFAYVASHDLKAPLRGIANLSQWIEEDLEAAMNPEVKEHLELLRGRVHRMEGLIDGILQYSRAGRVREKPEPVDVGQLIGEVLDLLSPPEGFDLRVVGEMPTLSTERLPLQQILMNLIGNAIKYSGGPEARVEVTAEESGAFHHFVVSDNGPGIAPEYHERIFGIFQTLEARDKVEGTGIGLSLVKKIVEARGGRVWIESEEGAGAAFHVLWPSEKGET